MALSKTELETRSFKLGLYFKPTSPIHKESLFAERKSQTRDVLDAINQQGLHAVMYGERGVGKTSLANMIFPKLHCEGLHKIVPLISCFTEDTYSDVWKRVFEVILHTADKEAIALGERAEELLKEYTGPLASVISPDEVWKLLGELGQQLLVVVIIDEFDKLLDVSAQAMMSDTIKFLSDRVVPATIVLIGVADSVESIVSNHRSVQRCLQEIYIPRMSIYELESIVVTGLTGVGMTIDEECLYDISRFSRGLPHYAHLLGLYAGRWALDDSRLEVIGGDVKKALESAVTKTHASIQADYSKAIRSSRKDAQYAQVLLACALAQTDNLGWFYPRNVREPLSRILDKSCKIEAFARHLHTFCELDRGPILKKDGDSPRPRFRFVDPIVQPYIVMRGIADKIISDAEVTGPLEEETLF